MERRSRSPLSERRGFTLIELLVVIAIIAILAAILFPVFAQAKAAAKKTSDLSNVKGTGTGCAIYLGDNDDNYPLSAGAYPGFGWLNGYGATTPAGWDPTLGAAQTAADRCAWANAIQPYLKSWDLLASNAQRVAVSPDAPYDKATVRPQSVELSFNGLLHSASASSVAAPSGLMAFSQINGTYALKGFANTNPYLLCANDAPCRYVPTSATCDPRQNGQTSYAITIDPERGYYFAKGQTMWVHTMGMIAAFADTSAKWRRVGANLLGSTDYTKDPFSYYREGGVPYNSWYDENYCHALLYRPDSDFSDYGTPIEAY